MASAQGNGVFMVPQSIPAARAQPLQQNVLIGQNDGWLQKFTKGEPESLAVVQFMIGIISICLGSVLASGVYATVAVFSGVVFWAPLFFFVSGGLSIASVKKRNLCLVKGALGMNTASAVVTMIAFIIYVIDLSIIPYSHSCRVYNTDCFYNYYTAQAFHGGILVVLLILSLLQLGITISTSAFGCKSVCGDCGSEAGQPVFVVQNVVTQDARFQPMQTASGIPIAQGGQVMTMDQ